MKKIFIKSMLPISLIIAATIFNLESIKNISATPEKPHVLEIEGGKVDLGKVSAERENMNILVYLDANNLKLFHIGSESVESMKLSESSKSSPIINITNMPPSQALPEFRKQISDFVALINKERSDKEKITIDSLVSTIGFAVRVNSYITYDSSVQGKFPMLVDEQEITIDKDTHILPVVTSLINKISAETTVAHKLNSYM